MIQRMRQRVVDRVAAVFVIVGADQAARLVEGDDAGLLWGHAFAVHLDVVAGADALRGVQADLAIEFHRAALDERVTGAAGADPAGGEVFVETDAFFGHGREYWRKSRDLETQNAQTPAGPA